MEMCEWEIIWSRGMPDAWRKAGDFWIEKLTAEGRSRAEIQTFLDERTEFFRNHPVVRFVDSMNFLFWKFWPVRWHSQDLNDCTPKRHWFHRRAWFYPFPNIRGEDLIGLKIGVEVAIPSSKIGIGIDVGGGDDDFMIHFGCGFGVYISFEDVLPRWLRNRIYKTERRTGIFFHHGIIWVSLWHDDHGWEGDRFKWQEFNLHVEDWILGKQCYSRSEGTRHKAELYFPEGDYLIEVDAYQATWKRRWTAKTVNRFEITPSKPIPIPGKGENSWDQDEDAVYGSNITADTLEEAIAQFTKGIYEARKRYGGEDWVPESMQVG